MTTSLSTLFHVGFFLKHNFVVLQLKHLRPKTRDFQNVVYLFLPSNLGNLSRLKFIENQQTVQMFNISVNFKDYFGKVIRLSIFFYVHSVIYQLLEIKDDIQVVSQFPCLLGHPVCIFFIFK